MPADDSIKQILIIDDDASLRRRLRELLQLEGFNVITAADGREGLLHARQQRLDLILCDITMPMMDGYQVLAQLQEDPATAQIPVIFLSAQKEQESIRRGMALGANDYLTKPVRREDLLQVMQTQLRKHGKESSPSSPQPITDPRLQGSLSAVKLAVEMLRDGSPERRERYVEILKTEVEKWSTLVAQPLPASLEPTSSVVPSPPSQKPVVKVLGEKSRDVRLRVPEDILAEVDLAVSHRRPAMSRHQWILEALLEKLDRESHVGL